MNSLVLIYESRKFFILHTTLFFIADEIDAESQAFFENEPVNSISKQEGYNNIAGWLSYTAPKLSKLGKRKISPEIPLEPEFVSSTWIDLQNRGT